MNQSKGADGLIHWVKAKRSIRDKDVVWYTLGVTPIASEEYPVMDVQKAGFMLVPSSFFSANPSIGLPPGSASP